jgi:nitrogen fixation protein NifU and related proteins
MALYSGVIRERFRHPRYRGSVPGANAVFEDVNPLCGDRIRIECRLDGARVAQARFTGDSCAIAAAAADVLLELIEGQPSALVSSLDPEQLLERLEADVRPSRMKCVALPLQVLQGALDGKEVAR